MVITALTTKAVLTLVFQRPWERVMEEMGGERQKQAPEECEGLAGASWEGTPLST